MGEVGSAHALCGELHLRKTSGGSAIHLAVIAAISIWRSTAFTSFPSVRDKPLIKAPGTLLARAQCTTLQKVRTRMRIAQFAALLILVLGAGAACAIPLYYTFEGQVDETADAAYPEGAYTKYVYLIDFDRTGEGRFHEAVFLQPDAFFALYIGGTATVTLHEFENYLHFVRPEVQGTVLYGTGVQNTITIRSPLAVTEWTVGQSGFIGEQYLGGPILSGVQHYSSASSLTLAKISTSVPEPSTVTLSAVAFGLGLLIVGVTRRRSS